MSQTVSHKRRIGVITTSRADYSHLYWPMRELSAHQQVDLAVFALGAHLSPEFGSTLKEIERDGFPIQARIECLLSSDTDTGMAKTIGVAILGLADALTAWRPDILLLIADRYEMLASASVALALRVPIAHIEGGEVSQGAIDDQVRNALTKLAAIHFTSTPMARRRVIAMGEEPWRVHHAGAPSLDHISRSAFLDRASLQSKLALDLTQPTIVAAWHPVTILQDTNAEADALFAALAEAPGQLIFVYPNSDAGSRALIDRTKQLAVTRGHTNIFINLDAVTYWSLLGQVDCMVGNSSSGIMEAASFALPVVNVGMRQQGRERARNVIDVPAETSEIQAAIHRALSAEFRASLTGMTNPYGNGTAAKTIARVLTTFRLEGLLIKSPTPVTEEMKRSMSPEQGERQTSGAPEPVLSLSKDLDSGTGETSEPSRESIPLSSPDITQAEIDAVTAVLRTPQLSLGPEMAAFEAALASYHAVPHAVAVSSGTAGLHLALLTLGIGEGDEVIVPSFSFIAVANTVLQVRATPVFAEIDSLTLNLDPDAVEKAITPRTRALLVVHTFGVPADMDALQSIARRYSLVILEDACEAIGAEFAPHTGRPCNARRTGSFGQLAVLGFYPNKQLTTGEGGAVLAHDPSHAARLRSLRNQGRAGNDWLDQVETGYNYRLSDIACALGRVQLTRIDELLALRRAAAQSYHSLLAAVPGLELPPLTLPNRTISWFVYVVRLPQHVDRDRVQASLATLGIATGRYFAPIHLQPAWRNHPGAAAHLPITESIARRTLALPFFNRITARQQQLVADALQAAILAAI
jgi:UDP-hydrolysing UDP-N-acetyl-D-glucosamine 2-epimerase